MRTKVLITGASGLVGFEAFKELINLKNQYQIRVLSLDTKYENKLFEPYRDMVEFVWGDIRNLKDVRRAIEGVDVILHVAGIIPPQADQYPDKAWDVNVLGTKNIIDACHEGFLKPKIIFTSSISVYGDRLNQPYITIDDPLNPSEGDEYARMKIEAEDIITNSGLCWTIFRLCGIFMKRVSIQPLMFHMPLNTHLEWCHPTDAGFALVQAIDHNSVNNRIFNLGGGENCRVIAKDFMRDVFQIWGLDSDILPEYAFAQQNFHSGYYGDGEELEKILRFRRFSLQDYLQILQKKVSPIQRSLIKTIPKRLIRNWLLRMSEPLKSIDSNNEKLINRFYGSRQKFYELSGA